jgi:hypothetical protein
MSERPSPSELRLSTAKKARDFFANPAAGDPGYNGRTELPPASSTQPAVASVVASPGSTRVVFAGDENTDVQAVLSRTRWQREHEESLDFAGRIRHVPGRFPRARQESS